jgi:hypothetical protein
VELDAMSPTDAWMRRINSGQAGADMMRGLTALGMGRATTMFTEFQLAKFRATNLRRWRNMHSIGLQQVCRCQGSSR